MEDSIDLISLFKILLKHVKIIIIISFAAGIIAYLFSATLITKKYTSSVQFYVENKSANTETLSSSDISVAQQLANTCSIIFTSSSVLEQLAADENIDYNENTLSKMIAVSAVNSTEIMKVTVTANSPSEAQYIAKAMRDICILEYERIISTGSITTIDSPKKPTSPSYPNNKKFGLLGFIAGFVITCLVVILRSLFDTRVKANDNLTEIYEIPVFAEIMDFEHSNSQSYSYKYGNK